MLDLFYPQWKLQATLSNQRYFDAVTDIYQATYGTGADDPLWSHPHGPFDASTALAHVDRIGYRIPDRYSSMDASNQPGRSRHVNIN